MCWCHVDHPVLAGGAKEEQAGKAESVGGKVESGSREDTNFSPTQGRKAMTCLSYSNQYIHIYMCFEFSAHGSIPMCRATCYEPLVSVPDTELDRGEGLDCWQG